MWNNFMYNLSEWVIECLPNWLVPQFFWDYYEKTLKSISDLPKDEGQ